MTLKSRPTSRRRLQSTSKLRKGLPLPPNKYFILKKAIIIGATSGIGKELAKQLAKDGYQIGITGRRQENLLALQATAPEKYIVQSWDATTVDNETELEKLVAKLGGLDLLVMNSGVGRLNKHLMYEHEKMTMDLNVIAFTQIMAWGFRYFRDNGGGQLVGISSVASLRGSRHAPAYSGSKAYQANYMEGLRNKAFKDKLPITVTDIRPGFVDTPMTKGQKGMFWVSDIEKATRQICSGIKSKRSVKYITNRWRILAIVSKLLPRGIYKYL